MFMESRPRWFGEIRSYLTTIGGTTGGSKWCCQSLFCTKETHRHALEAGSWSRRGNERPPRCRRNVTFRAAVLIRCGREGMSQSSPSRTCQSAITMTNLRLKNTLAADRLLLCRRSRRFDAESAHAASPRISIRLSLAGDRFAGHAVDRLRRVGREAGHTLSWPSVPATR